MNQHGYHCPECDCSEGIKIAATATSWVCLMEDGVEDDGLNWEWDDTSDARCLECDWHGKVVGLVVIAEEEWSEDGD